MARNCSGVIDGERNEKLVCRVDDTFTGMVTVIQRFDSALRFNVHFYTMVPDGVYVKNASAFSRSIPHLFRFDEPQNPWHADHAGKFSCEPCLVHGTVRARDREPS